MVFAPLENAIIILKDYGFFDILLPLLLVFSIFYAVMVKVKLFGDENKGHVKAVNFIVSAIVAFIFVTETGLVQILNSIIPRTALLLVITLLLLIILAFVGVYDKSWFNKDSKLTWIIAGVLILVFLGILDMSGIYIPGLHEIIMAVWNQTGITFGVSAETLEVGLAIIVFILVPLLVVFFMIKDSGSKK